MATVAARKHGAPVLANPIHTLTTDSHRMRDHPRNYWLSWFTCWNISSAALTTREFDS